MTPSRCFLCPRVRSIVPPVGPGRARVLFLAECPSFEEDKRHEPLVGKTGVEFSQTYLPIAGLPRSEVCISNAVLCSRRNYDNPTPEDALACSSTNLGPLLAEVRPQILVPMGKIACSLWPEINLNLDHGRPLPGKWGNVWEGVLFPIYHPSSGLYQTGFMISLSSDFDGLRKLIAELDSGEFKWPRDLYPNPDYRACYEIETLADYLRSMPAARELACDTESLPDKSGYCVTISHTPGTGRLLYVHDGLPEYSSPLAYFRSWLNDGPRLLIFHNYLHDVEVFDKLQLPIPQFADTMVRAYHLCLGGGGDEEDGESRAGRGSLSLKVLAYRHLNMRMSSFQDTVYPHSKPHVLKWLWEAEQIFRPSKPVPRCVCGHPQSIHEARGKTGRLTGPCGVPQCDGCVRYKKQPKSKPTEQDKLTDLLHRKVTNLILDLESGKVDSDGDLIDPWKRIKEWPDYDRGTLEGVLGPCPVPSVAHVPEKELLEYAVRDADSTLRLYYFLKDLKPWIFWND